MIISILATHSSCSSIRASSSSAVDGDYIIYPQRYPYTGMKVYCRFIDGGKAEHWITLNPDTNFAHWDGRRYLEVTKCGGAFQTNFDLPSAGYTKFSKIKIIDMINLEIANDYSFSTTISGNPVPYGSAHDCHGSGPCPLSKFKIDLTGTCVRLRDKATWIHQGPHALMTVVQANENRTVFSAKCGGDCGGCGPVIFIQPMDECE